MCHYYSSPYDSTDYEEVLTFCRCCVFPVSRRNLGNPSINRHRTFARARKEV